MKRFCGTRVWVCVVLLALGVATPVAAELRTLGQMGLDFSLERSPDDVRWIRRISSRINMDAEFFPGDRDNTRVVVQMSGWSSNASNSDKLWVVPDNLKVDNSYLEVTTALWVGGPPWLVRIGDQYVGWSSLLSPTSDRSGITVSNVNIGPLNTRFAYLWGSSEMTTLAATGSARVGSTVLSGTYVSRGSRNQLVFEGTGYFLRGMLELQAGVSLDAQHVNAGRFAIGIDPIPDWSFDLRFNMRERYDPLSEDYDPNSPWFSREERSEFAVSTYQLGTRLDARFDFELGKHTRTWVSGQRMFYLFNRPFNASYSISLQGDQPMHSLMGQTSADLGVFRGIGLMANYHWGGPFPPRWSAQASYSVPSGPSLSIQYDNSQRTMFRMGVSLSF